MRKAPSDWGEADVLALPTHETDEFERKGSKKLDLTLPGVKEGDVLDELAKQLSAFSNTGGGQIIYGVANNGAVDAGGVASSVRRKQSTKEWLEDVIPTLTEFEIVGFNVYEITAGSGPSTIENRKGLYVVDVPDSDRVPHQSTRDQKYYVRLGGKSRPARHRLIEDIRSRQKYPQLQVSRIQLEVSNLPFSLETTDRVPIIDGEIRVTFHISLENVGQIMAKNTCLKLEGFSWRDHDNSAIRRRGQPPLGAPVFWEMLDPIYPGMKIEFWIQALMSACYVPIPASSGFGGPWLIGKKALDSIQLAWWLFADNAPVKQGAATMEELGFERAAGIAVDNHPRKGLIRLAYRQML